MRPTHVRLVIIVVMLACIGFIAIFPVNPELDTSLIFDDEASQRIQDEGTYNPSSQLILRLKHDDGNKLTNNISRVQNLLQLENDAMNNQSSPYFFASNELIVENIETPFSRWSEAFESRNRSLENATQWSEVLTPVIEDGWCGSNSTFEEQKAFEATLLLMPEETIFRARSLIFV